jgi:DNA-binding SARP family transcriptional activator/predicted ATPase
MLEIQLLGPMKVRFAGHDAVRPAREDTRWLLAYLLIHRDEPMCRPVLAGALWPEAERSTSLARLRRALHRTRSELPETSEDRPWIVGGREFVGWNVAAPCTLDLDVFRMLYRRASWPDASVDPVRLRADLQEATALGHRTLLEGDDAPWIRDARRDVTRCQVTLLERLADVCEVLADPEGAQAALTRLLEEDRAREDVHRRLMRHLWLRGDATGALRQYVRCRDALAEELDIEPQRETRALEADIRRGSAPAEASETPRPASSEASVGFALRVSARRAQPTAWRRGEGPVLPTGAPRPRDRFIGRTWDLVEGQRRLASERFTVLMGPPGCGKSRLALELARDVRSTCPDVVYWVDLDDARDATSALRCIASVVAGRPGARPSCSVHQIAGALRDAHALLVLDNCERVSEAVADIGDSLLWTLPRLRVLATSRRAVGGHGASAWRVGGLRRAGELYLDRASSRGVDIDLTEHASEMLEQLGRRLARLPLAMELAAHRALALPLPQLLEDLRDPMPLLVAPAPLGMARYRSLRGAMRAAFDPLPPRERCLLEALCRQSGPRTRRDIARFLLGDRSHWEILDTLEGLVDDSLVEVTIGDDGLARYAALAPMRDYVRWRTAGASAAATPGLGAGP